MRIKELDGIRGIAVLMVVLHHYFIWLRFTGSVYGWLGVDLFFILSGYLITSILLGLRDKPRYFATFYTRRALRIFPPYIIAISAYLLISILSGKPGTPGLWLQYIFYYTSLFVGQPPELHANPPVVTMPVMLGLAVLWTLSVEELFYTFWAPVVRWFSRRQLYFLLVAACIVAPILRWLLHTPKFPEIFTFYCRMDALAYGALIALILRDLRSRPDLLDRIERFLRGAFLLWLPVTIVFWLALHGDQSNRYLTSFGLILADVLFTLSVFLVLRNSGGSQFWLRILRTRWLRGIGKISYSLYLFNYPIRYYAERIVAIFHLSRRVDAVLSALLGIALSYLFALALWYLVESRILALKPRLAPDPA